MQFNSENLYLNTMMKSQKQSSLLLLNIVNIQSMMLNLPPHFSSTSLSPSRRVCLVPVVLLVQGVLVDPLEMLAVLVSLAKLVSG